MKMVQSSLLLFVVIVEGAALSGCLPYDHKFLCEENADYGRCTDVGGAYQHALSGEPSPSHHSNAVEPGAENVVDDSADLQAASIVAKSPAAPRQLYQDSQYRAMAGMIDAPVAPLVVPAKVVRTLVLAYQDESTGTMYMPRYVYSIVEGSKFVMGVNGPNVPGLPMLYPNGGAPTVTTGIR